MSIQQVAIALVSAPNAEYLLSVLRVYNQHIVKAFGILSEKQMQVIINKLNLYYSTLSFFDFNLRFDVAAEIRSLKRIREFSSQIKLKQKVMEKDELTMKDKQNEIKDSKVLMPKEIGEAEKIQLFCLKKVQPNTIEKQEEQQMCEQYDLLLKKKNA